MAEITPKRILMTGDTVGGVWNYTLMLAEALGAHGSEVILAAMGGPPSAAQFAAAARIRNLTLLTSSHKLEWMEDPWEDVAASGRWVLGLERKYRPDAIHLNTYAHAELDWEKPVVLTAHSCVLSWWDAVRREALPEKWHRYRDAVRRAIRGAAVLVAPTRAMLEWAEGHYGPGLPDRRMVVPSGYDVPRAKTAAKEELILTEGRLWDEAKNPAAVAKAAEHLPWPVYLAGDDRSPDGARAHFKGCQALGWLTPEELSGWYARASIYAQPARYEPFGRSALEAALSGCVLVLGDIPSVREVWQEAAIYVSPDNCEELERVLQRLIAIPSLREEMAYRARVRAREYTPERMAQGYREAYAAAAMQRTAYAW